MTNFTKTILSAAMLVGIALVPASAAELSPVGSWELSTGESRYQVTRCGDQGEICAKLVWLRDDARTAENLRYLNKYVVRGAVPAEENRWKGSVHYEGETVRGSMTMVNSNTLRLRGCKLIACQSLELNRI